MYYKNANSNYNRSLLFKLSIKNMAKSIKDYSIYFLTLVLGVAIFYMFNSLDSQEAMLQVSRVNTRNDQTFDRYAWNCIYICSSNIRTTNSICQ